jgi:nucleotide-binding universal stress UspA family protein
VQTIVVAYDDPESRTLTRAVDLAQGLNAALIVTNVVSADRESAENVTEYGHERLEQARAFLAERGLEAELVPIQGQPAEAIVALAEERNADLIVVGMRKKRFFERLVEGSVAQDVMRRAACDVLAVH